jgi:hypothetical protein
MRNFLRLGRFAVLGALLMAGTTACYVHSKETVVEKPVTPAVAAPTTTAATCTNTVWVEGHYDAKNKWVPGYWGCTRFVK